MCEKRLVVRRIYGLLTGRPMNFSFIDEYVSGSACPLSKREVNWFRKILVGVRCGHKKCAISPLF